MRMSRIAAGLVTAGLVAVPVAVSAPADAAALTSTTTLAVTPSTAGSAFFYGAPLTFTGATTGSDGSKPTGGTATLQISTTDTPTFTAISTDTTPDTLSFPGITAQANASYKVVFSGFADATNSYSVSESAPVTVTVGRTITLKARGRQSVGKVLPGSRKSKVVVFRKIGKRVDKYAKVTTDKKGRFTIPTPTGRTGKLIVAVKGDAEFAPSVVVFPLK